MISPEQCDRIDVVLVSPRNPLNIGAAARAMANFGFRRLSIVAPFAMNWMEAKSAVGAPDLLREAQVFDTLAEAVANCTLVLGTGSLDRRRPEQRVLRLAEAAAEARAALGEESSAGRVTEVRVAIVFGSEKHGLTSDDLSWCHALAVIETSGDQPSMNLGQAVAVCLYEISRTDETEGDAAGISVSGPADTLAESDSTAVAAPVSAQLDRLAGLIEETMAAANYSTRGLRSANGEALRVLLRRLMPNEADSRRMMGLFRRVLWQLGQRNPKI